MEHNLLEPPEFTKKKADISEDKEEEIFVDYDKESRIAARRKRIQLKIQADRRAKAGERASEDKEEELDEEKKRQSYKQIRECEARLKKLVKDGITLVTNVQVAGDSTEVKRRQEEEEARRAKYERIEAEVTAGAERFEEIMKKWLTGKDKRIPQDLQALVSEQKEKCSAMLDEKDKLAGELELELRAKDDQYVKYLKKQSEDINLILERMEDQAKMLLKSYQDELLVIEKAFTEERRSAVESHKRELNEIMKDRAEKEEQFLIEKDKRIEKHEEDVQHLRIQNAEAFNHIKIKLETDIQSLQQQIQQMKATFQLNAEKLEYNFQVLKKRDEENTVTISQQKRRLTRLQDTLNNLRGKMVRQEKACKAEVQLLIDDYKKNTEMYRKLQKKVKHFQSLDTRRFHNVWEMNEEKIRELASEALKADETIHKQQLGLEYDPPPVVQSPMRKLVRGVKRPLEKDISRATIYASQVIAESRKEASCTSETLAASIGGAMRRLTTIGTANAPHYPLLIIKEVLELLCSECEFLMEDKLLKLLAPLDQEEQMMMKLDSIFKAIGVENEEAIHQLVKFFMVEERNASMLSEDQSPPKLTLIHPNAVISRLLLFVESRQGSASDAPFLTRGAVGTQTNAYKEVLGGAFWKEMSYVPPDSHEKLWTALIDAIDDYHSILQGRSTLISTTDNLRQQNTELSLLLHQYAHARINFELVAPPTLQVQRTNNV